MIFPTLDVVALFQLSMASKSYRIEAEEAIALPNGRADVYLVEWLCRQNIASMQKTIPGLDPRYAGTVFSKVLDFIICHNIVT